MDAYLKGYNAWGSGGDELPPRIIARTEDGADLYAMGWADARDEGVPRPEQPDPEELDAGDRLDSAVLSQRKYARARRVRLKSETIARPNDC